MAVECQARPGCCWRHLCKRPGWWIPTTAELLGAQLLELKCWFLIFFALGTFPATPCGTFSIQWDSRAQTDLSSLVWRHSYGMEGPSSRYKRNGNLRASLWGKYWQSGYVNVQKQRPLWAAATRLLRCQSPVRHWIHCLPYGGLGKQATASLPQLQLLCCLRLLGPLPWSEAT